MADDVTEVKSRVDIVDLIGSYLSLKQKGGRYWGCCPFHREKTPSFTVSAERQSYHCFGCGASGDVFSFVQEHESLTFRESLEQLAHRVSYQLSNNFQDRSTPKRDRAQSILNFAADFFQTLFRSKEGEAARAYMEKRGFDTETLDRFGIGYAPDDWTRLVDNAHAANYQPEELLEQSLVSEKGERVFDFFRHRVMFPVHNAEGKVVAFGGRVLGDGEPKYLNSRETDIFNKRKLFFNFHRAREKLREHNHFLIMEGYTDVMMADRFNVGPAIATLGTALTQDHVKILSRFAKPVFLVYDADEAGQNAAEKSLPLFLQYKLPVKVLRQSHGKDPCDFLLASKDPLLAWKELRENAIDLFDFRLARLAQKNDLSDPITKNAVARQVVQDLVLCKDEVLIEASLQKIASFLSLSNTDSLFRILKELQPAATTPTPTSMPKKATGSISRASLRDLWQYPAARLLSILALREDFIPEYQEFAQNLTLPNDIYSRTLEKFLAFHTHGQKRPESQLFESLNEEEKQAFNDVIHHPRPLYSANQQALMEEMQGLLKKLYEDMNIPALLAQLKDAKTKGDSQLERQLMLRINEQQKLKKNKV